MKHEVRGLSVQTVAGRAEEWFRLGPAMSRLQMRSYGTQEFRDYPFIDLQPLPDIRVSSYVERALHGEQHLGPRVANPAWPKKPFLCRKTGKAYLFWGNYLEHVRKLSPLYGPPAHVVLQTSRSPHDDRTFHFRQNLKLHNRVKRFQKELEDQVQDRLRGHHHKGMHSPEVGKTSSHANPVKDKMVQRVGTHPEWPRDVDNLPGLAWPDGGDVEPSSTFYRGWTKSDSAESWFLEDPGCHSGSFDDYVLFYQGLCSRKVVRPKLHQSASYP